MQAIISITTIPTRIKSLELAVQSLVGQGLPIYVWLPRYVERLNAGFDSIPDFFKDFSNVHVEIVENQGPATKLLPALDICETVLTADDDNTYSDGWARGFLEWAEKRPDAALGYSGRVFKETLLYGTSKVVKIIDETATDAKPVHIITSFSGTLYHRSFFDPCIFTEWQQWPLNDDIVFGGHLWERKIPMLVIPRRCTIKRTFAKRIDALWGINRHGPNDEGLRKCYPTWGKNDNNKE